MKVDTFSIKGIYREVRGDFTKVLQRRLICNNQGSPKWTFILYLARQEIFYTKDRLEKCGIHIDLVCSLCNIEPETNQHLFLDCTMISGFWKRILCWLSITWSSQGWSDKIIWATTHVLAKSLQAEVYRIVLTAIVYHTWQEREYRIFWEKRRSIDQIIKRSISENPL